MLAGNFYAKVVFTRLPVPRAEITCTDLPGRRQVSGVQLHVSIRKKNGFHPTDAQQTVTHAAAKLVDGLRFERRMNGAVLVVHLNALA